MKIRSLEKVEKIKYPTLSTIHNNSFMKKVPLFSAVLSSMLLTNNAYATESMASPIDITPIIAGGLQMPPPPPSPLEIGILITVYTTAILSLIAIFINAFKAVKLSKSSNVNKENNSEESIENNDKATKLKKLKKKTYIALAIFILSLTIVSFITNFY